MVIMHGCEGQGSLIASYQLEVSCLLDFTYYPFDRQVQLFLYLPVPSKNFIFQTCKLEFSLPDNGLDDDTLDKLDLVWKKDPKIISTPALHDGLMNDWDRSVQFYRSGEDCESCEKDKLRLHFILTVSHPF